MYRVLQRARIPFVIRLCLSRLIFNQIAYLLIIVMVFESTLFMCGLRQGGPLSDLLFDIACACLLAAIAVVSGVTFCERFFATISSALLKEFAPSAECWTW